MVKKEEEKAKKSKAGEFLKKYKLMKKERISSGVLPLDIALNNSFELGGCYAIASPPGGGKSTLILQICKKEAYL